MSRAPVLALMAQELELFNSHRSAISPSRGLVPTE